MQVDYWGSDETLAEGEKGCQGMVGSQQMENHGGQCATGALSHLATPVSVPQSYPIQGERVLGCARTNSCHQLIENVNCLAFWPATWLTDADARQSHHAKKQGLEGNTCWCRRCSERQNKRCEWGPDGSVLTTKIITLVSLLCVCAWHIFVHNFHSELSESLYFSHVLWRAESWILLC